MTYIPCYDSADVGRLIRFWVQGSLDGICSQGAAIVGVKDCDRMAYGVRSTPLLERYTSQDIRRVIEGLAVEPEPYPTYSAILMFKHVRRSPLQDLARALRHNDCSSAQSLLIAAQDEFMRRLLA